MVRTSGGHLAIRSLEAGEVMHPGVGPLREARELYVEQSQLATRLTARSAGQAREAQDDPLVLFDVGLGAGSNALAARQLALSLPPGGRELCLVSYERDLDALALALEQGSDFGWDEESSAAARAVLTTGEHRAGRTRWLLRRGDLLEALSAETQRADIVYWDPFSPKANPALWTVAAFSAIRRCARAGCTLFTYSASTTTRVALLLAGWAVGVGAAIGDKAETTAAAVSPEDLARPLDHRFLARLERSQAPLPADAPPDARAEVAAAPQFQTGRGE